MTLVCQALIVLGSFILGVYATTFVALFGDLRLWGRQDDRTETGLTLGLVVLPAGLVIVPLGLGLLLLGLFLLKRRDGGAPLDWRDVAWPVGIGLGMVAVLGLVGVVLRIVDRSA